MSKERRNRRPANGHATTGSTDSLNDREIICFRLPVDEVRMLKQQLESQPVVGIRSAHQLSRKIVMDYCKGNLVYPASGLKTSNPQMNAPGSAS